MKKRLLKEGDLVRIKPKYSNYYSNRVMNSVGIIEKCVKIENPTYTRYFYIVRFKGIDKLYRISSGVLQFIIKPMIMNQDKNTDSQKNTKPLDPSQLLSDQLISNFNRVLDEAAARIKNRAELRAKAEQERHKNSITVRVPYTRAFQVAENADSVRSKLRTIHSLLLADQKVTPAQIEAIMKNFDECRKMIHEIASCAVQKAQCVNK